MKKIIAGVDEVGRGSLIGPVFAAAVIFKTNIGRNPLIRSKKNVRKPAILFPLLITFVAPGLLEPNDLGSGKEKIFEMITANGIDPII